MDGLFEPIADATGASLDQIKLISCLLFSYPLGSIFIRIPAGHPEFKHIFSILITTIYLVPVLNLLVGFIRLTIDVVATYYIAKRIETRNMPWIVFVWTMGNLTISHILRASFSGYDNIEISGPQMVLTMKLTTFAWNVWDGRRPSEDLDAWQTRERVTEFPSLLEFLGYAFYFPGFLVGPYLTFNEYQALVTGSLYSAAEKREEAEIESRFVPSGRKRVAFRKMFTGLIFLGLYVVFYGEFNYTVALEQWFVERSVLFRIFYLQICAFFERTKYYAIWMLTEGASIQTGLGFTGYTAEGITTWGGAANVDILSIEFAPNVKILLDSWNMKTNQWLRECIYKRVTPKGKKPGFRSSLATFATSAFWHGIAPGYYLAFFYFAFVQTLARLCRAYLRPIILPATYVTARNAPPPPQTQRKQLYDIMGMLCTYAVLTFGTIPFMLLTIDDSLHGWYNVRWYGLYLVGAGLLAFYGGGRGALTTLQKARVKHAQQQLERDRINRELIESARAGRSESPNQSRYESGRESPAGGAVLPPLDEAAQELERYADRAVEQAEKARAQFEQAVDRAIHRAVPGSAEDAGASTSVDAGVDHAAEHEAEQAAAGNEESGGSTLIPDVAAASAPSTKKKNKKNK